jgi:hypothetical protein
MTGLTRNHVPPELHELIPLAEKFGVADDLLRERLVKASSAAEIQQLKSTVLAWEDALDKWLAGVEADGPAFSDEYIAFSAMRMAADYA